MKNKPNINFAGLGYLGALNIMFIGMKLGEVGRVANWSWWRVMSPIWIPWLVVLGLGVFALVCLAIYKALD